MTSRRPYYDIAQVCSNGHVITPTYQTYPQDRKNFCDKCGAQTIHQCPACKVNIQGAYVAPGFFGTSSHFNAPAYCHNCGQPFPWTKMRLQALRELALETEELDQEKEKLIEDLPDLTSDTPRTTVAATRWKKALEKVGESTLSAFKEILIEVASETAKKLLFP